ncbi:lytic transglycosylase domain-containing protein [Nitrogeniibacter mangrovi]|uniref:Lytic transglycosylase domain-containing protein n=1 Tax=Nitrogeniibacter mangrovi TaxID=2016596 RepID=A0A6C1AZH4_9RHOO|nr:lytic transglycosylase domain-containing protein [Nitrogeniibacter mangrovi]QID16756.1 lytic transglycosylase domain-containing protein [Nitrogeniibacter mangrovi]
MPIDGRLAALVLCLLAATVHADAGGDAYQLRIDTGRYRLQDQPGWQLPAPASTNPTAASRPFAEAIAHAANAAGIEPELLHAVVQAESGYRPDARSDKGATGLTQLMPGTAKQFDARALTDAHRNLQVGARYLRRLLDRFGNDRALALAAYNAGPGAVTRYGGIPPYPETRAYVARVLREYTALKAHRHTVPQPWQLGASGGDAHLPGDS